MTDRPTDAQLAELTRLAKAAVPGPWNYVPWHIAEGAAQVRTATYLLCELPGDDTAAFIAAAYPQAVLGLIEEIKTAREALQTERKDYAQIVDALQAWVNDLHSDMYINCVYCGHRYGPNPGTPIAMADVLKEHIAQCPKHPASAMRTTLLDIAKLCDATATAKGRGITDCHADPWWALGRIERMADDAARAHLATPSDEKEKPNE